MSERIRRTLEKAALNRAALEKVVPIVQTMILTRQNHMRHAIFLDGTAILVGQFQTVKSNVV